MTATNIGLSIRNVRSARGYRKAREDDHRRALAEISAYTGAAPDPDAPEDTGASEDLTPDVVEPIIGLRAWRVQHSGFLVSYDDFYWEARKKVTATCGRAKHYASVGLGDPERHQSPGKACSCGIYAAKRELEIQYATHAGPFVWGRVAVWGRVEESERGYRGQYAYPVSLTIVNCPQDETSSKYGTTPGRGLLDAEELEALRDRVALHYGIPVRIGSLDELTQARRENYEAMGIPAEVKELVG